MSHTSIGAIIYTMFNFWEFGFGLKCNSMFNNYLLENLVLTIVMSYAIFKNITLKNSMNIH
jgi:hypothetical protein